MYYAMLIGGDEKTKELFKKTSKEMGAIGIYDLDRGEIPPKEMLEDIKKSFKGKVQKEE